MRPLPILAAATLLALPTTAAAQSCVRRGDVAVCRFLLPREARTTVQASAQLTPTAPAASAELSVRLDGRPCATSTARPGLFGFHAAGRCRARLPAGDHSVEVRIQPQGARVVTVAAQVTEDEALRAVPTPSHDLARNPAASVPSPPR